MNELTLLSFGRLFGLPEEADTIIGTRGLPNPYYVEGLKHKTGLDPEVRDYVFSTPEAEDYYASALNRIRQRIAFYHRYDSPLKTPLVIAVGCTGGAHRSVAIAEAVAAHLREIGCVVQLEHRDLEVEQARWAASP